MRPIIDKYGWGCKGRKGKKLAADGGDGVQVIHPSNGNGFSSVIKAIL